VEKSFIAKAKKEKVKKNVVSLQLNVFPANMECMEVCDV